MNETQRNIKRYKAALPGLRERVTATALLLLVSLSMLVSTSLAWYTISTAPEVSAINTTVAANGNLEIALVGRYDENGNVLSPDGSKAGDSSASDGQTLVSSNITWGNLVNLSDASYGLSKISLRPALLSGYNLTRTPLYGATYASDGRIVDVSQTYEYATWTQLEDGTYYFAAGSDSKPGVRAIASVTYTNATGDAARERLQRDVINAYADANSAYVDIITGVTMVDEGVSCMDALLMLMEIYVNEKADNVLDTSGTTLYRDYSGVVTYMYRLIQELEKVLLKEGEALLAMANMQIYLQDGTQGTAYFKSLDDLLENTDEQLKALGVNLESYATYKANRIALDDAMNEPPASGQKSLKELAELYDPSPENTTRPTEIVKWSQIGGSVSELVDIPSTTINGLEMRSFTGSNVGSVLGILNANSHTVVIHNGALKDTEQRLKNHLQDRDIRVGVYVEALDKKIENALVTTAAKAPFLSNNDQAYTFNLTASGNSGDATAQDTYGMAIDLWFRTNMADSILTLEGAYRYDDTKVAVKCTDKNGEEADLYDLVRSEKPVELYYLTEVVTDAESGEQAKVRVWYDSTSDKRFASDAELADMDYMTPSVKQDDDGNTVTKTLDNGTVVDVYTAKRRPLSYEAYQLTETDEDGAEVLNWYNSVTHMLIGSDAELTEIGYAITRQEYYPVIGYEGPNRVWMDWEELIEAGYMSEDSTTQGSGSCYVFYADPSEQTRILELLKAFSVAFIDQDGTYMGSARLDTADSYAINGKVTVPLVMSSGTTYTDEEGNEHIGITTLEQNQETWITAIVYLDGMQLTNEQVLSSGEIEGRLNFQFGSNIALDAGDDRELQSKYLDMTASAEAEDGRISTKDSDRITYEYDGETKKITVTITVDGEQPNKLSAFFIRSIGTSQGSRMETADFTYNNNGTWSADFELTKPGLYSLRSVIADGVEYELDDHPTVYIEGLSITSITCPGFSSGMIMSADTYLDVPVEAVIDADESLMPTNVRALFRSDDGKEYTALMSYDQINKKWVGTARITSSGTVTLKYLVMDGDFNEIPAKQSITLITKLGLKASIWCTNGDELPVEYTGEFDVDVRMKIVDDSGAEIEALESVWLYYHRDDSPLDQDGMDGEMIWNNGTGYYEGSMRMKSAGNYLFNRLIIKSDGVTSGIYRANAPTFTVMPSEPPVLDADNVFEVESYQFTAGEANATMAVNLKNAQTATVWALIENVNSGQKSWVMCTTKSSYGDTENNAATYYFTVPTNTTGTYAGYQDGEWKLTAVALQGVYIKDEGKMYSVTKDEDGKAVAPSLDEGSEQYYKSAYYVFDTTNGLPSDLQTYVVQTVEVKVMKADGEGVLQSYDSATFGMNDAGERIATFMQEQTVSGVTINIVDWNGKDVQNTSDVMLLLTYDASWSDDFGSYTAEKDMSFYDKAWSIGSTVSVNDGDGNLHHTNYVAADQILQAAGKYGVEISYEIEDRAYITPTRITYYVYSKAPTVTVTGTNPAPGTTYRVYGEKTPGSTANMVKGDFFRFTDYTAAVYIYTPNSGGDYDQEAAHAYAPSVSLALSGVPSTGISGATMNFVTANSDSNSSTFTFDSSLTATTTIGKAEDGKESWTGVDTWPKVYPAGKMVQNQIAIVYESVTYNIVLDNAITIDQPQAPTVMMYTGIPTTYTGTKPAQVVGNGTTITTTLPALSWTAYTEEASDDATWSAYTALSTNADYRVYTQRDYKSGWGNYRDYQYYDWTTFQSSCTDTITYYKQDMQILQWKINGKTYDAGATVTITADGLITAEAIISEAGKKIQNPDKAPKESTTYRYQYGYVTGTLITAGKLGSNYYYGTTPYTDYTNYIYVSSAPTLAVPTSANAATETVGTGMTTDPDSYTKFLP